MSKMKKPRMLDNKLLVGWNEWCALPSLGLPAIKAKIDTGAKTSALHAFNIRLTRRRQKHFAHFLIHPLQGDNNTTVECRAEVIDVRRIMSSNGHIELRYVVKTTLRIGLSEWDIELTLSNRDPLKFRLLLGREALDGRVMIDPAHALIQGRMSKVGQRLLYE